MKNAIVKIVFVIFLMLNQSVTMADSNKTDPLPSWANGVVKQNIIKFVQNVTEKNNTLYVPPQYRIATIDNDGTLWVEQPIYTQAIFAMDRIKKLSPKHPEWKTKQPFKSFLDNNQKEIAKFTVQDFEKILAVTHSGMTVDEFQLIVKKWLLSAKNPHFKRPYTTLVYQPMLELMNYLKANHFKVYIVTGGGQDFVRAYAKHSYDIPIDQIIGSATKTKFIYKNTKPVLIKLPEVLLVDDKQGKPEAINLFIGRKPILAIGNSDGDRQMLEWTASRSGPYFVALVHHDDALREYAYGPKSKIGTFSDSLMKEAKAKNWNIISMKNDWKVIFPF